MINNLPFDGTVHSWSPAQLQFAREKYTLVLESLQVVQDRIELAEDDLQFAEDLYARMNKLTMQLDMLVTDIRDRSIGVERIWNSPRS
jgi:hypothetical protein